MTTETSILVVAHQRGTRWVLQSGSKFLEKSVPEEGCAKAQSNCCRRYGHVHRSRQCPAFGEVCNNRAVRNHFAKQCRAKTVARDMNSLFLGLLSAKQQIGSAAATDTWHSAHIVAGQPIAFKLDTGCFLLFDFSCLKLGSLLKDFLTWW